MKRLNDTGLNQTYCQFVNNYNLLLLLLFATYNHYHPCLLHSSDLIPIKFQKYVLFCWFCLTFPICKTTVIKRGCVFPIPSIASISVNASNPVNSEAFFRLVLSERHQEVVGVRIMNGSQGGALIILTQGLCAQVPVLPTLLPSIQPVNFGGKMSVAVLGVREVVPSICTI